MFIVYFYIYIFFKLNRYFLGNSKILINLDIRVIGGKYGFLRVLKLVFEFLVIRRGEDWGSG